MSSSEEILEVVPDKEVLSSLLARHVLEELKKSEDAAYHVYLSLATKFGAGQRI